MFFRHDVCPLLSVSPAVSARHYWQPEDWLKYLRQDITKRINEAAFLQNK
jgi:hypothetical protein